MPVLADLAAHSLIAITGEPDDVDALVRAMLLRLAFDHSPTDLSVAGCLGRGRAAATRPGCAGCPTPRPARAARPPVAVGVQAASALLDHLPRRGRPARAHHLPGRRGGRPLAPHRRGRRGRRRSSAACTWSGSAATPTRCRPPPTLLVDLDRRPAVGAARPPRRRAPSTTADGVSLDHAWRTRAPDDGRTSTRRPCCPPSTAIPQLVRLPEVSPDFADLDDADAVHPALVAVDRPARPDRRRRRRRRHPRPARGRPARPGRRHHRLGQERAAPVADLLAGAQQPAVADQLPARRLQGRRRLPRVRRPAAHRRLHHRPHPGPRVSARSPRWAPRSPPASTCSRSTASRTSSSSSASAPTSPRRAC